MKQILILCLLVLVLALAACSAPASPTDVPSVPKASATGPAGGSAEPDWKSLNTCTLLPKADIESVLGTLRRDPQVDPPNGSRQGCLYYDQEGQFADIILGPTSDWSLLRQLQPEAADFVLNGDKAFSADKPDAASLWVLRQNKAVIQVRVSSKDLEQAKKFVPKVIARLP